MISAVKLQYLHQEVYKNDLSLLSLEKIEAKKVFFLSLNGISCISALSAARVLLHLFILCKIYRLGIKQLITEPYTVPMTLRILRYTELPEQCFGLKCKLSFDMQTGKYWVVTRLQLTPTLALLKSLSLLLIVTSQERC